MHKLINIGVYRLFCLFFITYPLFYLCITIFYTIFAKCHNIIKGGMSFYVIFLNYYFSL